VKALADFLLTLDRVQHPGARLPWRLVSQVLGVAAGQYRNPVTVFILSKFYNR